MKKTYITLQKSYIIHTLLIVLNHQQCVVR